MELLWQAVALGVGATLVMDLWALIQKKIFSIPSLNYSLVGRWLLMMPKGRLFHSTIIQSPVQSGETAVGWIAHYLIGIAFSVIFILMVGRGWLLHPSIWPALLMGVISVIVPLFIMQPCFGLGVAGSKTPSPWVGRRRSLIAHLSFGIGLWLSALLLILT